MYNLSQPMSFQTAAMAALDAVESRTTSTQSSPEKNGTDTGALDPNKDIMNGSQKKSEGQASQPVDEIGRAHV